MGNSESNLDKNNQTKWYIEFRKSTVFLKNCKNDPVYGDISIYKNIQTLSIVGVKTYLFGDINEEQNFSEKLIKSSQLDNPYIIKLFQYDRSEVEGALGLYSDIEINCVYEYCFYTLFDDLTDRKKKMNMYFESELWYILQQCVYGIHILMKNDLYNGQINLQSILINDDGNVKIMNYSPWNRNKYRDEKIDVQQLGLVLLQASQMEIFDDNPSKQQIDSMLQILRQNYSTQLYQMVKKMLCYDILIRPNIDFLLLLIESTQKDTAQSLGSTNQNLHNIQLQKSFTNQTQKGVKKLISRTENYKNEIKENISQTSEEDFEIALSRAENILKKHKKHNFNQ